MHTNKATHFSQALFT